MLGVAEDEKEIKSVENIIAKNAEEYVSFDLRFRCVSWQWVVFTGIFSARYMSLFIPGATLASTRGSRRIMTTGQMQPSLLETMTALAIRSRKSRSKTRRGF